MAETAESLNLEAPSHPSATAQRHLHRAAAPGGARSSAHREASLGCRA